MSRVCASCGVDIYRRNKTGFCKPCFSKSALGLARIQKAAQASTAARVSRTLDERIAKFRVLRGADECWGWSGAHNGVQYPVLRINKKIVVATHVALEIDGRPRPSAEYVACHSCDNPICTNPKHLWWGTEKQNMRDAASKGRLGRRQGAAAA